VIDTEADDAALAPAALAGGIADPDSEYVEIRSAELILTVDSAAPNLYGALDAREGDLDFSAGRCSLSATGAFATRWQTSWRRGLRLRGPGKKFVVGGGRRDTFGLTVG
jgi:hypothetical protein